MLEIDRLDVKYGESQVLHGLSLTVQPGEFFGLIGRNGMGKSTLIHTIMRLLQPTGGGITWGKYNLAELATEDVFNLGIAWVPQGRRVFKSLSVGEHISLAHRARNGNIWTPQELLDQIPILRERWSQRAGTMSGGQQQILAVARALVSNPELLLVDEPSEGLDQHHRALLQEILAGANQAGCAVILVEQQVGFIQRLCTRVGIMERGEVVEEVGLDRLRSDPDYLLNRLAVGH